MDKYTIVIMDYTLGALRLYHFDKKPEDPEEWIRTHDTGWSDSSCYWMGGVNVFVEYYGADTLKEVGNAKEEG